MGSRSSTNSADARPAGGSGQGHLGGEGAVFLFQLGFPRAVSNGEFRVDEAKLFIEVPVMDSVYVFHEELNHFARRTNINVNAGELYVDLETFPDSGTRKTCWRLRMGRIGIPLGKVAEPRRDRQPAHFPFDQRIFGEWTKG
ncbi:MAG: hypothetical protein U1G07_02770 [Verrucomicrobiota bacterium]